MPVAPEQGAIVWVLMVATFAIGFLSSKKVGWLPYPTLLIFVMGIAQIVMTMVHDGDLTYNMLVVIGRGGLKNNFLTMHALYTGLALFALLSLYGKYKTIKSLRIKSEDVEKMSRNSAVRKGSQIALGMVTAHFICFFIVMDWGSIWYHAKYLSSLANEPILEALGFMFVQTILRAMLIAAALASMVYCIAANAKQTGTKIVAGFFALVYFLLLFSFHSRSAILVPLIIGFNAYIMKPKARILIVPVLAFVGLFTLACVLEGRQHNGHGLSMIPGSVGYFFSEKILGNISSVIVNMSEGAFATSESLQIAKPFTDRYKILAFSPLPSFIDGYSKIMASDEHRLHLYAPMSGFAEAMLFGWPFFGLLLSILFVTARLHASLAEKRPTLFLFCNFLLLFSMHYMFAYPLRNALRYVWLDILLCAAALWTMRKTKSAPQSSAALPPRRANVMSRRAKIGIPAVNKAATKHE